MAAFIERLRGAAPTLWLDAQAYAARLLAGGRAPWLDTTAFVVWQRKLIGLLKPDVAVLPVAAIIEAWLANKAELRAAMAAKSRAVFPVRTLLADESLRARLLDLTRSLRAGTSQPLALVLPSPRAWVGLAYRQAHGTAIEVGDDEADSTAVFIADFLRGFGDAGVDALLLEEAADNEPGTAASIDTYQSVLNVAGHYQWDTGLRFPIAAGFDETLSGYAFVIAPRAVAGAANGRAIDASFWDEGVAPGCPAGGFRYVEIPVDAPPERVLERLATLR